MIVLDTNVLSEAARPSPSKLVIEWLGAQDPANLFTTTITQAEILIGVEFLPEGRHKEGLRLAAKRAFAEFAERILPFDEASAAAYAKIAAHRRTIGRPISQFDAMIAGIVHSRNGTLATRDITGFSNCEIRLTNPWSRLEPEPTTE